MNTPHIRCQPLVHHPSEVDESILASDPLTIHFVFQRPLYPREFENLQAYLEHFFVLWQAHGKPLVACGLLSFNQLLTVLVDESKVEASGCSKDALFRAMTRWSEDNGISLAPRSLIPLVQGDHLILLHWKDCKKLSSETHVVDISSGRWSAFISGFNIPAKHTPLKGLFGKGL